MNNKKRRTIMTVNRSKKLKKTIVMLTSLSIFVTCSMLTASADGGGGFQETASAALVTVVTLIGGALGAYGVVNLLEGYGNDNPGAKSQGIKQTVAGVGLIIVGATLIPAIFG